MQAFRASNLRKCIGGGVSMIDAELSTPFRHVVGNEFAIIGDQGL